ncbi:MAG: endonuclease Q family protein, partial [Methanoregulaceae archaeon]|nr:endonuclease Q family protein [Methanoregulaceae archaeon]
LRPPYLHTIPLSEIIRHVLGCSSVQAKACTRLYDRIIAIGGDEIRVLTATPVAVLAAIDDRVANAIGSFRSGKVRLFPGGGGRYGSFSLY